jgi:hypothetical protein
MSAVASQVVADKSEVHRKLSLRLWRVHAMLLEWGEWEHRWPGGFASTWVTGSPPNDGHPTSQIPTGIIEPENVSATRRAVHALELPEWRVMESEYCFVHEPRRKRIIRAIKDPDIHVDSERERVYRERLNRARWQAKALLGV